MIHQHLLVWQTVAKVGVFFVGEWALSQTVAVFHQFTFRRELWLKIDWPPELNTKLFGVLHYVWLEAKPEVLGCCMEQYPDDPASEQAAFLLAGLLRTRIKLSGNVGRPLRTALSALIGESLDSDGHSSPEQQAQKWMQLKTRFLRELPAATRIAWSEGGPEGGISSLRTRVVNHIK